MPRIYLIDAFANGPFSGNPAAVCPLREPADEVWMQKLATEMNQAETAFPVRRDNGTEGRGDGGAEEYDLRWFTPALEVDLCGHATLATAHVIWEFLGADRSKTLRFHTRSGVLTAAWIPTPPPEGEVAERSEPGEGGLIRLDFPSTPPEACEAPEGLGNALGAEPVWVGRSRFDYMVELRSDALVRGLEPSMDALNRLPVRGLMVTAGSADPAFDFVSRFFAPGAGVPEDHATGSAHCCLTPYWSAKLGKARMKAFQVSKRGGWFEVELTGGRVFLEGRAATVLSGELA